jgi:cytochrome oxidase Cu insertion factor (SCO1/SenC/PrrC family)
MSSVANVAERQPRVRRGQIGAIVAAAALAGIALGVGLHLVSAPPRPALALPELHGQATWAAGVRPAPNFTLRDQSGHLFTLASLRGHTVALAFLDSHCTQECPLAGRALARAEATLPAAERPVFVAVSVNPLDTPASARAAAKSWGLSAVGAWHWVMADTSSLSPVWGAYHIYVHPTKTDIVHTQALYLIDRRGFERSGYLWPYLPNFVALDLRTLAGEST